MHRSYSILGALFQVIECSDCWLRNAEAAAFKFRSYQSPLCSKFPDLQLEKFPAPIQNLLLDQVSEARKWIAQCEPLYMRISIPGWRDEATVTQVDSFPTEPELESPFRVYRNFLSRDGSGIRGEQQPTDEVEVAPTSEDILADLPHCECRWFRAWQLPCAHIWHHHLLYGSLMSAHLAQLAEIWATNGYEIYEEVRQPFRGALDNIIGVPARVGLDWRERLEVLNAKFYSVTDWLDKKGAPPESKKLALQHFIDEVSERLVGIENFDMESWYQEQTW